MINLKLFKLNRSGKLLKNKKAGFTILETLVAISIILIAITGPIDVITASLRASFFSRDQITAFYLAQEAIEYAKNQRDHNSLNFESLGKTAEEWLDSVVGDNLMGVSCINLADLTEGQKVKCSLVQDATGVYSYESCGTSCVGNGNELRKFSDSGVLGAKSNLEPASNFTREIFFTYVPTDTDPTGETNYREVLMTVKVYWTNTYGNNNKYVINERLFNWKLTN